jgi:hypothetical protein
MPGEDGAHHAIAGLEDADFGYVHVASDQQPQPSPQHHAAAAAGEARTTTDFFLDELLI